MPELPEVETLRRQLEKEVLKKTCAEIETKSSRVFRRVKPQVLSKELVKKTVEAIGRKGKYLIIEFSQGLALIIHLGMSGQLIYKTKKPSRAKKQDNEVVSPHRHLTIKFSDHSQLSYIDSRTFGQIHLLKEGQELKELSELGFDPIEGGLPWVEFASLITQQNTTLKNILTNQSLIAGIGNIYADEILFAAGLRFDRKPESLSAQEIRRLYRSIGEVLNEAIRLRGSTLADKSYVDLYGNFGEFQEHHNVYAREGLPCKRCRGQIQRIKHQGRSTFFCPLCQR